jgi:alpha-D-xyloside xylohydrolase
LPYVIYNDYYNHKDFITALVNSSFIGVLWTPEVRASKTAEEWIRRMQSACFSPMAMINAWADGTKPWTFPEVADAVKEVANLRMQLLPYLYTTFAAYYREGKPPFRAMQLVDEFSDQNIQERGQLDATTNPYQMAIRKDIKDQYMMGDDILVAPMFAGEKSRQVILPKGKWYDFYSGDFVGENQLIQIEPPLEKIPLFVRDGGIIPLVPIHRQAPKSGEKWPLTLQHYGQNPGAFTLYDDDGKTFDYEKGKFTLSKYSVQRNPQGKLAGNQAIQVPMSYLPEVRWVFMTK